MTGNIVLIDCDIVAVSAAAAAEKRRYLYQGRLFDTKRELKESFPTYVDEEVSVLVEPQPLAHARQNARQLLQSILDACAPVEEYRGYITGPGNFRYEVATIQPYKGNRDKTAEPIWRRDIEEYLISDWDTLRCEGYEADDRLAVEFTKNPYGSILCSLDKDFKQIPNLRMYDWRKKEHITVTPPEALRNFYAQMLTGDVTDNIPGVKGIGEAKASKILDKCGVNEKLMATMVYTEYQKCHGAKAWEAYCENARLLYLIRNEDDLSKPKDAWKPCITPN